METDRRRLLQSALDRAYRQSTTSGGWPEHLSEVEQDAWMATVETEAILTGSAGTRLAGGTIDRRLVRALWHAFGAASAPRTARPARLHKRDQDKQCGDADNHDDDLRRTYA